jgi:hypothetical protein
MKDQSEYKEGLKDELKGIQQEFLFSLKDLDINRQSQLRQELAIALRAISLENQEKSKRAAELILANLEVKFLNEEKARLAAELVVANIELVFQNKERSKLAAELLIANKELTFQNQEKEKRAAELLKAKESAEESDRLKSAFLANMSHEIRTPMNGILGFADLLREPHLTGEMQQEYIAIIKKSGIRMLNIINDIICISKIESGLMEANIQEMNINHKIKFIHNFFKPEMKEKGIRFSVENTLPAKEAFIRSDSEKTYSILTNLVKNAVKNTEAGEIELGYVVKKENDHCELEFFVKDTGIGIPKERQMAIFERFTQADISNKMASQGAGLGLSISKAYVEMLGGKIWVESEEGKGSIFYFTLPYGAEQRREISNRNKDTSKKTSTEVNLKALTLKVLIVEDDKISRMLLAIMVQDYSFVIFEAKTGVEAVAILRNNPDIDLILMDIQMPVMNGYEATRQIRQFNKDVIIIAQTASGLSFDKENINRVGCNTYMLKPINKHKLLKLIQGYFKNKE